MATTNIQTFGGNVGIGTNDPGAYRLNVNGGTAKAGAVEVTSLSVSGVDNAYANIGVIAMWSGSVASIPDGWELCDGSTYSKSDGSGNITSPNLSGKFILGYDGTTYNIGGTGGSFTRTLTTSNLPSHTHPITIGTSGSHKHNNTPTNTANHAHPVSAGSAGNHPHAANNGQYIMNFSPTGQWWSTWAIGSEGNYPASHTFPVGNHTHSVSMSSAAAHNHDATVANGGSHVHGITVGNSTSNGSSISTKPAYYVLCFIMKI